MTLDSKLVTGEFVDFIRRLNPQQLQESFTVEIAESEDSQKYDSVDIFDVLYFLSDRKIGYATINVVKNDKIIEWTKFYPHEQTSNLERIGIGTLAHVSGMLEVIHYVQLSKGYNLDDSFTVVHYPLSLSPEFEHLLIALGVCDGGNLRDYLNRSIEYAARRGFTFANPLQ